jgi:DNA-binding response OmpR family regulator
MLSDTGSSMPIVLLVDDSPVALQVLAARMAAAGFDVLRESTVAGAMLAEVSRLACAVVDLELPDGDGVEVAASLRAQSAGLPIAFFTSGAAPSLLERAREHGPVFAKPDVAAVVAWAKTVAYPPPTK